MYSSQLRRSPRRSVTPGPRNTHALMHASGVPRDFYGNRLTPFDLEDQSPALGQILVGQFNGNGLPVEPDDWYGLAYR